MFFIIPLMMAAVITLISIEIKLRKKLENDEKIINRLDMLINKDREGWE